MTQIGDKSVIIFPQTNRRDNPNEWATHTMPET